MAVVENECMDDLEKYQLWLAKHDDAETSKVEAQIVDLFKQMYKDISAQIDKLYSQLGGEPTLLEASKYGRLKKLQEEIATIYKNITKELITVTKDSTLQSYANGVYGNEWAYDEALQTNFRWPIIPVEAIRESVWSTVTGIDFEQRFKNWAQKDYITVNQKITQGLTQGLPYRDIAKNIREAMPVRTVNGLVKKQLTMDTFQSIRVVATESTRAFTMGHLKTYDDLDKLGIKARKKWVATLDWKTRDAHGHLDGTFADKNGLFWIGMDAAPGPGMFALPENSINCRCRVVDSIEGFSPDYRRIRGQGIVAYESFSTWAKKRGWTEEKGWPLTAKKKVKEELMRVY